MFDFFGYHAISRPQAQAMPKRNNKVNHSGEHGYEVIGHEDGQTGRQTIGSQRDHQAPMSRFGSQAQRLAPPRWGAMPI